MQDYIVVFTIRRYVDNRYFDLNGEITTKAPSIDDAMNVVRTSLSGDKVVITAARQA